MHVFVTGATGFLGSAVVDELVSAGHRVTGLTRSDEQDRELAAKGVAVHRGSVDETDAWEQAVASVDGVVHTAFNNDFEHYAQSAATDQRVVEAFGAALAGSQRPFVMTSVTALLTTGRMGTEDSEPDPDSPSAIRIPSEQAAMNAARRGVRACAVRLPPSVHDGDRRGFTSILIDTARRTGVSAYVEAGTNRWAAVHRRDAARLYRLALESAQAGWRVHAVDEQGIALRDLAIAIGRRLDVPVRSISPAQAGEHFGSIADFLTYDNPVSSRLTRERLGWKPSGARLLADLETAEDLTH